jgi:hypothetical protein
MKKWSLSLTSAVLWITAMTMFTSCLEGGKNSFSNETIGVVRFDTKTFRNVLDIPGAVALYSPAFENMQEGACCYVVYEVDMNAPENDPAVLQANGYYTATITFKEEIDKYAMSPGILTDTTKVLTAETAITEPIYSTLGYLNGVLFMLHQLKKPSDQRTSWNLSYDAQNMMQDESGKHIYNVYLRATVRIESAKTPEDSSEACAYDMKYFMETAAQMEKSAGNGTFYIRFNYVSEIKDEALTWKQSDMDVSVSAVLPAEDY